jgi:hypothetical protein
MHTTISAHTNAQIANESVPGKFSAANDQQLNTNTHTHAITRTIGGSTICVVGLAQRDDREARLEARVLADVVSARASEAILVICGDLHDQIVPASANRPRAIRVLNNEAIAGGCEQLRARNAADRIRI